MDSLKTWWKNTGREYFGVAAIITVCVTIIFYAISFLINTVGTIIEWLGLSWVIRAWIGGCAGYLIVEGWQEYKIYKRNPDNYGFWNEGDDLPVQEEKEPTETGVE